VRPKSPAWPGQLLEVGSRGPDVKLVQGRLVQLKVARLAIDGEFGPMTEAAVKKFQRQEHLEVDGQVGPLTWKSLWSA
jgi:peptidoglycan hydrolase-like protein with peptidoglycan-binding domain